MQLLEVVFSYRKHGIRIWKLKQEACDKECLVRSVKLETSVMVWGCVTEQPGRLSITSTKVK